jgi:hypothetical protein
MKGEKAVEIFSLVQREKMLPDKIDDLVPLSFIGQAAIDFYRSKVKLMDQIEMTEDQRKATLKDGQDAGELLLEIEARIGHLAMREPKAKTKPVKTKNGLSGSERIPSEPLKHERLGLKQQKMKDAQQIAKHPEIVEKVKAKAKANDDIPTKTAVLSEIKLKKEKTRREKAEKNRKESQGIIAIEQVQYISALDKCLRILPAKPPKKWEEKALKEAKTKARLIIKRLEVFDG